MARNRSSQRKTDYRWTGTTSQFLALATGSVIATTVFSAASTLSQTLYRIRGELLAYVDATQAPGGLTAYGVGIIKAQGGQAATVLSQPISDAQAPWIWVSYFSLGYEEMVTDVIDVPGITSYRERIDSKAMRRMKPDQELQIVAQSTTLAGSGVVANIGFTTRLLFGD